MAVVGKNFSGQTTPSIVDAEYRNCNFSQAVPGTRIFPGDDKARTFFECNLVNCIPPPGSNLLGGTGCNTTQVERQKEDGTEEITIDGEPVAIKRYVDSIQGYLDKKTLKTVAKPRDIQVNPPEGSKDAILKQLSEDRDKLAVEFAAKEAELVAEKPALEVIR